MEGKTAQYGDEAMTAWTMFSWRRLYSGRAGEGVEDSRVELPADTRQLVYNVYVYFSRRPGRTAKAALTKTARATMLPRDIVADIIRDKYSD